MMRSDVQDLPQFLVLLAQFRNRTQASLLSLFLAGYVNPHSGHSHSIPGGPLFSRSSSHSRQPTIRPQLVFPTHSALLLSYASILPLCFDGWTAKSALHYLVPSLPWGEPPEPTAISSIRLVLRKLLVFTMLYLRIFLLRVFLLIPSNSAAAT